MRDKLVAVKIIIDPFVRAAAMRAAEKPVIESVRRGEIVNSDGEMERRRGGHGGLG